MADNPISMWDTPDWLYCFAGRSFTAAAIDKALIYYREQRGVWPEPEREKTSNG